MKYAFSFPGVLLLICLVCCTQPFGRETSASNMQNDSTIIQSKVFSSTDTLRDSLTKIRIVKIESALRQPMPVLLYGDTLNDQQKLAQIIALSDTSFTHFVFDEKSRAPLRCEIFAVNPARQSDLSPYRASFNLKDLYRVEMYNYALNLSSYAITDVRQQQVLFSFHQQNSQPDLSPSLAKLATHIAIQSSAVREALGYAPGAEDALMAATKTALNHSRCERSQHLCVAPTFLKDGKALWAIVDLTDLRLVGIRWTNVGDPGVAAPLTEKQLQNDKINACFCEIEQPLEKNGWQMKYMLTSSDGLRVSDVRYKNQPILRSAKLVDWHVSYSGVDGFGYSDAVGCPTFSQAAVIAWEPPKVSTLLDGKHQSIGFVLEQNFRSEQWPTPCAYNYVQRFEFYDDGRFRVACASVGRGCGNDGTYRPVFRIAFAAPKATFEDLQQKSWHAWTQEGWASQDDASPGAPGGFTYRLSTSSDTFYMRPGDGRFSDGGRGDHALTYITRSHINKDEGENDLATIGPCCNTDFHQGPEKYIDATPENITNESLVLWYVAQLKNDDRRGNEYCWAERVLENGVYVTHQYPCFCGPLFVPAKKR
jgi:hypothetical protein